MWKKSKQCLSTVFFITLALIKNLLEKVVTTKNKRYKFFTLPLRSFNSEGLENFSLEYLKSLRCEELSVIYDKLPKTYKQDDIIIDKSFRCYDHWPTEGDVPDCPPPFKIMCIRCILNKVPNRNAKVEEVIRKHLFGYTDFRNFSDDEVKHFPLFYLMNNVKGEHLLDKWYAVSEKYKADARLQSRLPCLEHNSELYMKFVYECYQCLYDK